MNYHDTIIHAAFDAALKAWMRREPITESDWEEAAFYHEEQQRGWMHDLDQEDQDEHI